MLSRWIPVSAVLSFAAAAAAQAAQPMGQVHPSAVALANVAAYAVAPLDRPALANEDDQRHAGGQPARYAVPFPVDLRDTTHGTWETLDAAWSLWRLRIQAPGASHVNLGFTRLVLPPTARLMVYSTDYTSLVRPFDRSDVTPEGELWTPVVGGEEIAVEIYLQTAERPQLEARLGQIGSGYRFFGAGPTALNEDGSGGCNIDVNCPSGAPWVAEIRSVAAISTGGSIFCSGFMVNNTAQDSRNFFMTANHCGITTGSAPSLVCYWNYQRAGCGGVDGPLSMFNTGAQMRASYATSDFTLVELNQPPLPAWGVSYAGWDRGTGDPQQSTGIHHPSGDDKKICFEYQTNMTTSYLGTTSPGAGTHIRVVDWDLGVTEPGSSGSPLFDQNHRAVGQLHGGYSACGVDLSDYYGRISVSWNGGGTSSSRLSNWLDPLGTGQQTVNTLAPVIAAASAYGVGCYTTYTSFAEVFPPNVCDLAGSAASPNVIRFVPNAVGYNVQSAPSAWYQPTSNNLALGNDMLSSTRSLPFAFVYPGGATNSIRICSNGFVWLNGTSTDTDFSPTIAELCGGGARLAPLWLDLDPTYGGSIHFDYDPTNTAVYCTWVNVPTTGAPTTGNTFQVVLRNTGEVEYRYQVLGNLPSNSLVGYSPGGGAVPPPSTDISLTMPFDVGVDAEGLTYTPTTRPVLGTTMTMDIANIQPGTIFGGLVFGWNKYNPGQSLHTQGMPGCYQYLSLDSYFTVLALNSTYNVSLPIPAHSSYQGMHLYCQAVMLTAGLNQLGAVSSNGIELLFYPY